MGCLHCHSSFLPHFQLEHEQILGAKEQLRLFCKAPRLALQRQNARSIVPLRTNGISNNSLFIGAGVPPSQSGDIAVFLQTSALLLVIYVLANFVGPYFISKYFEFDKAGEDQKTDGK